MRGGNRGVPKAREEPGLEQDLEGKGVWKAEAGCRDEEAGMRRQGGRSGPWEGDTHSSA